MADEEFPGPPPLGSLQRLVTDPAQQEEMAAMQDKDKNKKDMNDSKQDEKENDKSDANEKIIFNFGNTKEGQAARFVIDHSKAGDVGSILKAFQSYSDTKGFLMHVGDERGKVLDDCLSEHKPKTVLELGVYLGYSTIRIANEINKYDKDKDNSNVQFVSVELDKEYCNIANEICKHGSVDSRANILNGTIQETHKDIQTKFKIATFDLIFMDHLPENYFKDLQFLEKNGFVGKGTVIITDNVNNGWSDTSKFEAHVRKSGKYQSKHIRDKNNTDGIEVSVCLK